MRSRVYTETHPDRYIYADNHDTGIDSCEAPQPEDDIIRHTNCRHKETNKRTDARPPR